MPRILDKIIINSGCSAGERKRIICEYENLQHLAEEIRDKGWLDETDDFTEEMESLCSAHLQADDDYVKGMRALSDKLRKFIDQHQ